MCKQEVYQNCPICKAELPWQTGSEEAVRHLVDCIRINLHPEVADTDEPQEGCENLAPRPPYPQGEQGWRRQDFTKNLGNEEVE